MHVALLCSIDARLPANRERMINASFDQYLLLVGGALRCGRLVEENAAPIHSQRGEMPCAQCDFGAVRPGHHFGFLEESLRRRPCSNYFAAWRTAQLPDMAEAPFVNIDVVWQFCCYAS